MKIKKLYSCNTSFLDLLFNMLLAYAALFIASFALINLAKRSLEIKAAYLITVTWPVDFDDDVDAYVEDSEGHIVFFGRREEGLMHLDRDDLGYRNDTVMTQFGPVKYNENKEIITLRGTLVGEYCVNVHAYRLNDPRPVEVTIQLDKVSPIFSTVVQKKINLYKNGDEKTAFRFKVNSKSEVESVSNLEKSIIQSARTPNQFTPIPMSPDFNEGNIPPE